MNRTFRKTLIILLVFALITTCAACGGSNEEEAAIETINIGALYNLTGGQASLDQPSFNGFKLAADEINAN